MYKYLAKTWNFQDVENIDTQCTCEQFTIANSPGTTVFCNLPVVPEENGDIILTQANTCVMTCDGHFVTEISCGFNDSTGGTSWFSNMGDGGEPDVVSGKEYFRKFIVNQTIFPVLKIQETPKEKNVHNLFLYQFPQRGTFTTLSPFLVLSLQKKKKKNKGTD